MKPTPELTLTLVDKVGSLIRKKPDIQITEAAKVLGISDRTILRALKKEKKTNFRKFKNEILDEINVILDQPDILPLPEPIKMVKKSVKPIPVIVDADIGEDLHEFNTLTDNVIVDRVIPTEITTEWIEQETLNQYYHSTDPKDRQKLLSIMQTIWAVKHKVPTENIAKTQSMEDLLARLS